MNDYSLLFPIIVAAIFILVVTGVQLFFYRLMRNRKRAIEGIERTELAATSTPLERPLRSFKNRAKDSLKVRFSIFRRVILVLVLLFLVAIGVFPFVDRLPQALISILVGSTAVIIGIASRPFLENFLSGVAITVSKKLNIGDTILIDNQYGKIEDISSTHTILKLWDWRRYVIPNSTMISHEFINYSLYDKWQWTHVEFFVSYEADLDLVRSLAMAAPAKSPHYADFEEPSFWIMETSRDAIKCWIAAWAESADKAWELKGDIRTELIIQFQKHGIRTHLNQHALLPTENG